MKKDTKLTEEVETLRKWLDYYKKHDREIMAAYTEVCNELAVYKFNTNCLMCEPKCKETCKACDVDHCSIRLQIHHIKMARIKLEEEEDVSTKY